MMINRRTNLKFFVILTNNSFSHLAAEALISANCYVETSLNGDHVEHHQAGTDKFHNLKCYGQSDTFLDPLSNFYRDIYQLRAQTHAEIDAEPQSGAVIASIKASFKTNADSSGS
ncbi:hypothetical protein TNCV_2628511 [Trichonephila clavipes]|uniref:Uncharacterized protein n=1 Tax=Trichonephila clavipes TaxID=2585209 RepID=A0A8X6SA09_TRICX|nr:hypothetical protein TNCV_2628511 [Trichonephila clavipes]